jgi:shikimate kinase
MVGSDYVEFLASYRWGAAPATSAGRTKVCMPKLTRAKTELPKAAAGRFIVLVGLMGAGKTSLGKRLAKATGLPFVDSDTEIEKAANCSISDIFARFGEAEFRSGERRVIERILEGEPAIVATGGGAFMDEGTRKLIQRKAISIWLRADLETLVRRTRRRDDRPLLKAGDPREVLKRLIEERHPIYGEADIVIDVDDEQPKETTERLLERIGAFAEEHAPA